MYGRVPLPHMFVGAFLGVAGGFYIYKPIFEQYHRKQNQLKEKLQVPEIEEKKE